MREWTAISLIKNLGAGNDTVNAAIAVLKDPGAVEVLIGALKDSDTRVRRAAAYALSKNSDPRAVERKRPEFPF